MVASSRNLPRCPNETLAGDGGNKVNSSAADAQPPSGNRYFAVPCLEIILSLI